MLGLRFIWIDAICIVQDDPEDWARESSKMVDVYSRSFLTIAAASAKDSNSGCFILQGEQPGLRHEIRGRGSDGAPFSIYIREQSNRGHQTVDFDNPSPPLLSRGWALQERFLSPRVVFFGNRQMFYECNTASACESRQGEALLDLSDRRGAFRKAILNSSDDPEYWVDFWHKLAVSYLLMQLTFKDDVLLAISGVAHRVQNLTGSKYYAGIWSHSIVKDLQWMVYPGHQPRQRKYLAPTWSWASDACAILFSRVTGPSDVASDPFAPGP